MALLTAWVGIPSPTLRLKELVTSFPRIKEEMTMISIVSRRPWRLDQLEGDMVVNQLRSLCPWVITYYIRINTFHVPFASLHITSLPSLKDVTFHSNFPLALKHCRDTTSTPLWARVKSTTVILVFPNLQWKKKNKRKKKGSMHYWKATLPH